MSVDQQIREGLVMLDQRLPTPDTSTTYEEIVREARTRTRRSRLLQAGLVAAAAAAVVVTGQLGGGAPDPVPAPEPVDEPTGGSSQVTEAAVLEGTWRTVDRVSARDMAERVRSHGEHRKYLRGFAGIPGLDGEGSRLTLTFRYGEVTLSVGEPSRDNFIDWQTYELDDGILYFRPMNSTGGRSIYTAVLDGDELELRFFETNVDPVDKGLAEATMQPGLFTTSPYQRVG